MTYIIIAILLLILELAYFRIADRLHIVDKPNIRSSYSSVMLRGGGIIFLLGIWLYALFFGFTYKWFLLGLTLVGGVSFVDDIRSLPNSLRLVVQFIAMILMFYQFGVLNIPDWWLTLISLIICVGILNAYNFMDGINGITGGYSLVVLAPLMYLNVQMRFIDMPFLYVTAISLLIFCIFNFRSRAKCCAGDVGAIAIAYILLFAIGRLILKTGDFAYLAFIAMYGADAILTICHRIQLRENLGEAHRKHAYQIMANELGIKHIYVSLFYMGMQLIISFGLILCPVNHYVFLAGVVLILLCAYLIFMKKYYRLHEQSMKS